ncbi:hypothetical protein I7I50_04122 [Histoplasma capsulatum G186AR]|uniref:Uncharacterized protein n=1 Tax=Ajellomyces capsulatus TaxID=5037 RepID=A0A8H8CXI4_AJECA|nr:hypothetical protein I7I52_05030 [Histoplasma capsulatum]QSS75097.1 hypothetical protein I7I50_04122 [Histoplasma capsulatum G186AR]
MEQRGIFVSFYFLNDTPSEIGVFAVCSLLIMYLYTAVILKPLYAICNRFLRLCSVPLYGTGKIAALKVNLIQLCFEHRNITE